MTREEAIKEINKVFEPSFANYIITALTEGATASDKALEQQPCEDCISRQAVLDSFWKLDIELRPFAIDAIVNMINNLPPVTQKEKSEYKHDHEVVKAYNDGQAYILDKIRREIEEDIEQVEETVDYDDHGYEKTGVNYLVYLVDVLEVIDKYRGDTDGKSD